MQTRGFRSLAEVTKGVPSPARAGYILHLCQNFQQELFGLIHTLYNGGYKGIVNGNTAEGRLLLSRQSAFLIVSCIQMVETFYEAGWREWRKPIEYVKYCKTPNNMVQYNKIQMLNCYLSTK